MPVLAKNKIGKRRIDRSRWRTRTSCACARARGGTSATACSWERPTQACLDSAGWWLGTSFWLGVTVALNLTDGPSIFHRGAEDGRSLQVLSSRWRHLNWRGAKRSCFISCQATAAMPGGCRTPSSSTPRFAASRPVSTLGAQDNPGAFHIAPGSQLPGTRKHPRWSEPVRWKRQRPGRILPTQVLQKPTLGVSNDAMLGTLKHPAGQFLA